MIDPVWRTSEVRPFAAVSGSTGTRRGTVAVLAVDVHDGLIADVWLVINPDKLRAWTGSDTP